MTKDNFTADRMEGFDELGGRDSFTMEELEARLGLHGCIDYEPPAPIGGLPGMRKGITQSVKSNPTGKAIYGQRKMITSEDELSDDD